MAVSRAVHLRECPLTEFRLYLWLNLNTSTWPFISFGKVYYGNDFCTGDLGAYFWMRGVGGVIFILYFTASLILRLT